MDDIFTKEKRQLIQEIELKQGELVKEKLELPPIPEYDARLMTKRPRRQTDKDEILESLHDYVSIGLSLDFPTEETWRMRYGKKTDTGTIRQPIRAILKCAQRVMT